MIQALNCPNCGAPLGEHYGGEVVRCNYCNTSFGVPKMLTPEPDMGELILGADFSQEPITGWEILNSKNITLKNVGFPVIEGHFAPANLTHYLLTSNGWFDDFDVSVSLRFIKGPLDYIRGGFIFRYQKDLGGYIFFISPQKTYRLAYYIMEETDGKKELAWKDIINWTNHTAIKEGMDVDNRIRIVAKNSRLRIYLNGVLAMSITDDKFKQGQIRIATDTGKDYESTVQFSNLQVREARD